MIPNPRSILVATDLGEGSDALVRSAASLAARAGAELHLVHSLELPWVPDQSVLRRSGFFGQIEAAQAGLRAQVERSMPEGVRPASQEVVIYVAHRAILDRAREVAADMVVVGPHRGGAVVAHFLGTTADRVVRSAEVPCLVVTAPLAEPVRRIGVAVDFSDPSQGALETALAWGRRLGAPETGPPSLHVMNVGWTVDRADVPDLEGRTIRPALERQVERAVSRVPGAEAVPVEIEVRWGNNPSDATVAWAEARRIDLLVLGTHGRGGVRRALLGSVASGVARRSPCAVLLVPPSLWSGQAHAPRLERVLSATDFSEVSVDAVRWAARALAPEAEHLLLHVLEVPDPPALLPGRGGSREELVRSARAGALERLRGMDRPTGDGARPPRLEVREGDPAEQILRQAAETDADVVVLGEHGRSEVKRGSWTMLGTTAERVLRASPAPVLVVRTPGRGAPRRLLVAVDGSESSLRALCWADFLRDRFGASLEALFVETPAVAVPVDGYAMVEAAGAAPSAAAGPEGAAGGSAERQGWLREQAHRAGVDPAALELRVAAGSPAAEILSEGERTGAELIVMGTQGRGALGRAFLGSVAGAVLRAATCPVLVVPDPEGRE